jgi:replicative DNA helicase
MSGNLPPPHDAAAERAIISAVLTRPESLLDVTDHCRPEDFYGKREREAMKLAVGLESDGADIDIVSMFRAARGAGLEQLITSDWLSEAMDAPTTARVVDCAKSVQLRAKHRRALLVFRTFVAKGESPEVDVDAWLTELERELYETMGEVELRPVVPLRDTLADVITLLGERGKGKLDYLPTSLSPLNRIILGWAFGKLQIVAGDPGDGKTSFVLQEGRSAAERGYGVVFFSYEMTRHELVEVLIGQVSGVSSDVLQSGKLEEHWPAIAKAKRELDGLPIDVLDDQRIELPELRSKARRQYAKLQREHGGRLRGLVIVVDYIQLMPGPGEDYERISHNSTGLSLVAKELGAAMLVTSQFNRDNKAGATGKRRRPSMRDLKGSGSLEQDAHKIMFIYNENSHLSEDEQPPDRTCIFGKNRGGKKGDAHVQFDAPRRRFIMPVDESHDWIDDFDNE